MCSNCTLNVDKNLEPAPPLCVAINAFLFENALLQWSVVTDSQVIALVKIGGDPPLYSGAQNIRPSEMINFSHRDLKDPSSVF